MNGYRITHLTQYQYDRTVQLRPHTLRLCPRSDGSQWLQSFQLSCSPTPKQQTYCLDANGNTCTVLSFTQPLTDLSLQSVSEVNTARTNPFDYLSEPWAVELPIDYPLSLAAQLGPYLKAPLAGGTAPTVAHLAQALSTEVSGNVGYFLTRLTQYIPTLCDYQPRQHGAAYSPGVTLEKKAGTCRDFAVLFVAVCRAVGLAARFVSGYQEGDLETTEHELHAWAEVYIPGGGWRGFDPTLGLAVADRHIAIAAAPSPQQATPVSGTLQIAPGENVHTTLTTDITIEAIAL
ncbi:MAG: transglutaminase family protein [Cyanobacteria bacterium J06627_32]